MKRFSTDSGRAEKQKLNRDEKSKHGPGMNEVK